MIIDKIHTAIAAYREHLAKSLNACFFSSFDIVLKILDAAAIANVSTINVRIINSILNYFFTASNPGIACSYLSTKSTKHLHML